MRGRHGVKSGSPLASRPTRAAAEGGPASCGAGAPEGARPADEPRRKTTMWSPGFTTTVANSLQSRACSRMGGARR